MSDGLNDNIWESDSPIFPKEYVKGGEKFEGDLIEMMEIYSDLSRNWQLAFKSNDENKLEVYLSNVNYALRKIKEIIPKEIQVRLRYNPTQIEKEMYKHFSDQLPNLSEL